MQIEPFAVELWMNAWETGCDWNLTESCVQGLKVQLHLQLAGGNDDALSEPLPMHLTYGAIDGSKRLCNGIGDPYDKWISTAATSKTYSLAGLRRGEPAITWIKPQSGTTALLRYALPIRSEAFCAQHLKDTYMLLPPGAALNMERCQRIGYAN
ncbi:MAG: hypothetical protein AAF227_01325 [Pseudomonadota bacterium]